MQSTFHTDDGEKLKLLGVITQLCHVTELLQMGQLHPLCIWRPNTTVLLLLVSCINLSLCAVTGSNYFLFLEPN